MEHIDDGADSLGSGELIPLYEHDATLKIVQLVEHQVRTAAKKRPARRDAHPKAHGCVQADFKVLDNLPPALRAGVFSTPRTYKAWIRFSNGSEKPQRDGVGDGRGMAIKLVGVEDSPSTTQDFLMINHPAFFVRNAADYVDFQAAVSRSSLWRFFIPSFNPFRLRLHEAWVAFSITRHKVANPLSSRYWSMTPYRFGDRECKYSARPSGPESPYSATEQPNFLKHNLASHLASHEAAFDFMVQLRTSPDEMPIEDPTITWDENDAPFIPVALITIPKQTFDSPDQLAFCENLSFTPWHCIEEHRPLGGINRVRRTVYETISRLRHELNSTPRSEPTEFPSKEIG